jgi:hypothetical protein
MSKELIKILDMMHDSLRKKDNNFHTFLKTAYCGSCDSIVPVGGDYNTYEGRDCDGDHFKINKADEKCLECKRKTPEVLIKAIENGLRKIGGLSLYSEELPEITKQWKKLSKKEKITQINSTLSLNKQYEDAKEYVKHLEEVLG